MLIFLAVITLILLIIIHELGHFVAAKKLGVKVEEFGLGYPPRLWGKKIGETLYSLNIIPFGGFVKIYGQEQSMKDPNSFSEKPFWKKSLIILGGVFSFWVISAVILTIVMIMGAPTAVEDSDLSGIVDPKVQVINISKDSPAEQANLELGDIIREIKIGKDQLTINKIGQVQEITKSNLGKNITLVVQRGSEIIETELNIRSSYPEGEGPMGISLVRTALKSYPWYFAPIKGIQATFNMTVAIVESWIFVFSSLFTQGGLPAGVEVTGVVGIFGLFNQVGGLGASYFLQFIALIAIHLALINALPIPALDGGWFMFLVIEKIKGRPLNQNVVQKISGAFFIALIALMIWVTVRDIIRIF